LVDREFYLPKYVQKYLPVTIHLFANRGRGSQHPNLVLIYCTVVTLFFHWGFYSVRQRFMLTN